MRQLLADGLELDDDPDRIDVDAVHDYLANKSYWAEGRPREVVERLVLRPALGTARQVRQITGQPEQLELEGERKRVERGP